MAPVEYRENGAFASHSEYDFSVAVTSIFNN
jgi:hypothetical protein